MAVEIAQRPDAAPLPKGSANTAPVPFHIAADLLRGLNREQRAAVKHGSGPLVVIAGPGTGKTEVVTRRIAWLIATKRAKPREILALTFTDNAAEEMQARVDVLVPYGQADAAIHTFHAFGDGLLREFAFELGLPGDVRLINKAEVIVVLRENMFQLGLDAYRPLGDPTRFLGALADLFGRAKDEGVQPDALLDWARSLPREQPAELDLSNWHLELAVAYERYSRLMGERGLVDHGDQICLPLRLLRERPAIGRIVAGRYRHVLVDEFQDLNPAQIALLHALTGDTRNVTVVGDPAQAIYTFRGAASDTIGDLVAHHGDVRQIVLRRNYRSRQPIIDAAQRLLSHAPHTDSPNAQLAHRRGTSPPPVRSVWYETADAEHEGVAAEVARRIEGGARPREFAVLSRSNGEAESIARALTLHGVPVRTQLPSDFFAQPHVRPLLAFLRVVADPGSTMELYALAAAPPYELDASTLTTLLAYAKRRHIGLWDVLADPSLEVPANADQLVADVRAGIEMSAHRSSTEVLYDHLRRSGRLAALVREADPSRPRAVARFFEIVRGRARLLAHDRVPLLVPHLDALIEAQDDVIDTGPLDFDAVSVLTVHRAKGLEFPVVFLTGLTEGRFPARARPTFMDVPWSAVRGVPSTETERLDEERRLCFVAMTRARDELWLSHHVAGPDGRGRRRPSPFIAEALDSGALASPVGLDAISLIEALGTPATTTSPSLARSSPPASFSFSELETYLDCPERYRLRHVVGLPTSPHHALTYGSALHHAVAAFHVRQQNGETMSEEELLEVFTRSWSPEGFVSREHEDARYNNGRDSLRRFREAQLARAPKVIAVEKPFVFQLEEIRIRGRVDRVDNSDEGTVIVDYKSSDVRDQKKADERARDSLQLGVYALAHEAETGALPHQVQLHFLDSGVVGAARPDPSRLDRTRTKLRSAADGIRAGAFDPRPGSVTCGYCPFRQICPSSAA